MFNDIYKYPGTIARHQVAPLVNQRLLYFAHCKEQGTSQDTLRLTAQTMLVIIEELELKADGEIRPEKIVACALVCASRLIEEGTLIVN